MMRPLRLACLSALSLWASVTAMAQTPPTPPQPAAPQAAATTLWTHDGITLMSRPLTGGLAIGDREGAALEISANGRILYGSRNAYAPQSIRVIWQQKQPGKGPDLVVAAQTGATACCLELTVINLAANPPVQIITLATDKPPVIADQSGTGAGPITMTAPLTLAAFNGATAQPVLLPVRWDGTRFAIDTDRLRKLPAQAELRKMLDLMRAELAAWTIDAYAGGGNSPEAAAPKTQSMLMDLILNGQAHAAKTLLYQAWPAKRAGRELYWRDLSLRLRANPLWNDLGLARLPNTGALAEP